MAVGMLNTNHLYAADEEGEVTTGRYSPEARWGVINGVRVMSVVAEWPVST